MSEKYAIKVGVAATLAMLVSPWVHLDPFYAVIGVIIVMSTTSISTWQAGTQRLICTIIGALSGAIFSSIFGGSPWSLGVAVMLTLLLSSYLGLKEGGKTAGFISAIVILAHSQIQNQNPWLYAWYRFLETSLGIAIALLVNALLFPSRAAEELRQNIAQNLTDLGKLYQVVVHSYITRDYQEQTIDELKAKLLESLPKGRQLWQQARQEQSVGLKELSIDATWEFLVRRIWEHILTMEQAAMDGQNDRFWRGVLPQLTQLAQVTSITFGNVSEAVSTQKTYLPIPDIDQVLKEANEQLAQVQRIEKDDYSIGELLRFFAFFYSMEEVIQKLKKIASTL